MSDQGREQASRCDICDHAEEAHDMTAIGKQPCSLCSCLSYFPKMSDQQDQEGTRLDVVNRLLAANERLIRERDELDQQLGECARRVLDLQNEREHLRAEDERLRDRVARMDARGEQWLRDLTEQDALIERLRAESASLSFQLAKARLEHQQAEQELDAYEKADEAALAEAQAKIERLTAELDRAVKGGAAALLLGTVTSMPEDLAAVVAERDEARDAAEHLWFHGEEHGVSHEEARRWYPWLYELHEQRQAARRREQS